MLKFRLPVFDPKTPPATPATKTLVAIDAAVDRCPTLATEVEPQTNTIVLNPVEDGVAQITIALEDYQNLEALNIILFGSSEELYLGNGVLSLETLHNYVHPLMQWSDSLKPNADIHLYVCNVPFGYRGMKLVEKLSYLTGARVAIH